MTRPRVPSPPLVDVHLDYSPLQQLIASLEPVEQSLKDTSCDDSGSSKIAAVQGTVSQDTPIPHHSLPQEAVPEDTLPQSTVLQKTVPQDTLLQKTVPQDTLLWGTVPQDILPQNNSPWSAMSMELGIEETQSQGSLQQHTTSTASDSLAVDALASEGTAPHKVTPLESVTEKDVLPHDMGSQCTLPDDAPSLEPMARLHHDPESQDGVTKDSKLLDPATEQEAEGQDMPSMATKRQPVSESEPPAPADDRCRTLL